MGSSTLTPSAPLSIQGQSAPDVVVNPGAFYAATRRMRYPMKTLTTFAGFGGTDSVQLRQTGIVAALEIRVTGTMVFGGTITGTTMSNRWPYNLASAVKLSANGQSQLINCNGLQLKALEFASNNDINDRGVARTLTATAATQGTLSTAAEDWGTNGANQLGPGVTVGAIGTYTVDLDFVVPVAADQISLVGAVFAQSAATNLTLDLQWETQANLLTLGGSATLVPNLQYQVTGVVYSIPNVGGQAVVPDLSQFHQVAGFRQAGQGAGDNEILLPGTGVGRKLMRVLFQTYTGATPAPLPMTQANFGNLAWRYGGSDQPEGFPNGQALRYLNERQTSCDFGRFWGIGMWDFASQFALRDVVDESYTSDLRLLINLVNAPTTPFVEIVQETLFAAPVGA
jgi:hypothetical protein